MNREQMELIETLTTTVTAFPTWEAFRKSMEAGYIPTLWPRKLRKNAKLADKTFAKATAMLAQMVREQGFKVFDGVKVA